MSTFEWDSEKCLVVLSPAHVEKALHLLTEGTLSDVDVETWANTLECRDDLAFSEPALSKVLFELANPTLTYPLSAERVVYLLSSLKHVG